MAEAKQLVVTEAAGTPIACLELPSGWEVRDGWIDRSTLFDCPVTVGFVANASDDVLLHFYSEDRAMQLGSAASQLPVREKRAPFMHIGGAVRRCAEGAAEQMEASMTFVRAFSWPREHVATEAQERERVHREAQNDAAIQGMQIQLRGIVVERAIHQYELQDANGDSRALLVAATLEAYKYPIPGISTDALGSLLNTFSGGLFRQRRQPGPDAPGAFEDVRANEVISWAVRNRFLLICPPDAAQACVRDVLYPAIQTVRLNPALAQEAYVQKQRMVIEANQRTQMEISAQNQRVAIMQSAIASQRAAMDAQQQAWFRRSDEQFASQRAESQAMFSDTAAGMGAASYSEAIRDVNTFIRPDGTEVEVSSNCDTAWTNAFGDVVGGSTSFDPGGNWTQLHRK